MKTYIAAKLGKLTTDGNMPASFQTDVDGWISDFEKDYGDFKVAEQTQVATAAKVKALNACFVEGMDMMKDAQRVFVNDAEVRSLFVFSILLDMINPKTAGVRGLIQDTETHVALTDVSITFTPENEPAIVVKSDEEGEYASLRMRAQVYKVKVEKVGYVTIEDEVLVVTGTVTVRKYRMEKLADVPIS